MRYLSQNTKERIIEFVDMYYSNNGYTPTISIISSGIGLSEGTVHKYLHRMTDAEELFYDGRHIITQRIKMIQEKRTADICGEIACGDPCIAIQNYGDSIHLPPEIVGNGHFFVLKAKGDSMINVGINEGDLAIIKQQNYADDGQIIAALIDGETATLKRYHIDHINKKVILLAENEKYPPITKENIEIMGVLVYLMKDMKNV